MPLWRPVFGRLFALVVCFSLLLSPAPLLASATSTASSPSQEPPPVDNPPVGAEPAQAGSGAVRIGSDGPVLPQAVAEGAIQPVALTDAGALQLATAMMMTPSQLTSARYVEVPDNGTPNALVSELSFFPTNGAAAALLTTGNALLADTLNESSSSGANLGMSSPVRGATAYDVTTMELILAPPAGANCLRVDFAFYSEEFPEYVGSSYNDALIAELNESTWTADTTINAPNNFAFDKAGHEISINGIDQTNVYTLTASGTTYDGATALLEAATAVGPGVQKLYLSIFDQGDNVYDSAALIDNIRFEKVADTATDCKPGARRKHAPLIFVPGVAGTRLNNSKGELWPDPPRLVAPFDDDHLLPLRLDSAGVGPLEPNNPEYNSVTVGEVITSGFVDLPLYVKLKGVPTHYWLDVYGTTMTLLKEQGYTLGIDLFVFPYDWRKSNVTNTSALMKFIDSTRATALSDTVDILAHSMGGILARAVMENSASKGKIHAVVTLGTPVLGAPKILASLRYQAKCFYEVKGSCITNIETIEKLLVNFPSAYELLPSESYQDAVGSPLVVTSDLNGDGKPEGERSYPQWLSEVSARNSILGPTSTTFHDKYDKLDPVDPNVRYVRVVGDRLATMSAVTQSRKCSFGSMICSDTNYSFTNVGEGGDGTVPIHSADLYVPNKNLDLRGNGINAYAHGVEHGDLAKSAMVISFALAYFNNSDTTASVEEVALQAAAASGETTSMGFEPLPIDGVMVEVRGPASAALFNALGFAGMLPGDDSPGVLDNLPGVTYDAIGDTQVLFFSKGIDVQSFLDALGNDQLSIQITRWDNGTPAERVLFATQISETDELSFTLTSGQPLNTMSLLVDTNGDGATDETLKPIITDPTQDDLTAPTVSANVQAYDESQALVTLIGNDAGGTGVNSIWYAIGAAATTVPYTQPLKLAEGQMLRFMAVDNAGNTSEVEQIVIAEQYGQVRLPIIKR